MTLEEHKSVFAHATDAASSTQGHTMTGSRIRLHARQAASAVAATALACGGMLALASPAGATPGDITTVAGTAAPSQLVQGSDSLAHFQNGSENTLYIGDWNGFIVKRDLNTGAQSIYAGTPNTYGSSGDGGPAAAALLGVVGPLAVDSAGDLYFNENDWYDWPDHVNECHIRRIAAAAPHVITNYAGNNTCNSAVGDGGDANDAGLYGVESMVFDSHDNLYVTTRQNNIRKIDRATHVMSTVAGTIWEQGYLDGSPANARFNLITGLAIDSADNLFVADGNNNAVRKINAAFTSVTTVVGGSLSPGHGNQNGVTTHARINFAGEARIGVSPRGALYIGDDGNALIRKVVGTTLTTVMGTGVKGDAGDDGSAVNAQTQAIKQFAFDDEGVYMSNHMNNRVRYIKISTGVVTDESNPVQPVGDGGLAVNASLNQPVDLLRLGTDLYVAEREGGRVRKIDLTTGIISTFAGNGHQGSTGDGGPATAARLSYPLAIAATADHSKMYIGTSEGHIRMVNLTTGIISTVAGTGTACVPTSPCGDGGPATSAQISPDLSLTVAPDDDVIIGDYSMHKVRRIDSATGIISTLAGTGVQGYSPDNTTATSANLDSPARVIVSPAGTVVFGEVTTGLVREIKANGKLETIAGQPGDLSGSGDGGQARNASIAGAVALRYDAAGNLYIGQAGGNPITQAGNNTLVNPAIRMVDATNHKISTFAGTTFGFSGDGGPATAAQFSMPTAIAPDAGTDLYVADLLNNRIRRIEGVPGDLVTEVKAGVLKAGATGRVTIKETNAGAGWVTGPVKATVTLPAGLTYRARGGTTGWTCSARAQIVKCVTRANMAPRAKATINLTVNVAPRANATLALKATSTSDSVRTIKAHQVSALRVPVVRAH
jgi:hypothetical protein